MCFCSYISPFRFPGSAILEQVPVKVDYGVIAIVTNTHVACWCVLLVGVTLNSSLQTVTVAWYTPPTPTPPVKTAFSFSSTFVTSSRVFSPFHAESMRKQQQREHGCHPGISVGIPLMSIFWLSGFLQLTEYIWKHWPITEIWLTDLSNWELCTDPVLSVEPEKKKVLLLLSQTVKMESYLFFVYN